MESGNPPIYSVAQLTRRIKNLLEEQIGFVWVAGEISNLRCAASGHAYFTLKDATSQVDAVAFKGRLSRFRFTPENGLDVLVYGQVTVYERRGSYQLVVEEMQPKGLGALQLAYEKLKKKLAEEGLFSEEHKKRLPLLPRRIGVVTSPTGAAIRDILQVIHRRFANVHIVLYPARVQGEGAAQEIAAGIGVLDRYGVDVMIVGRGGGSLEDLWAFNEEVVARAIYAAKTPIISAVGHEIDYALSDFVADLRAPTPSAAAELVVREQNALAEKLKQLHDRMERRIRQTVEQARARHLRCKDSYVLSRPESLWRQQRQQLDELHARLGRVPRETTRRYRERIEKVQRLLVAFSPQKRLERQAAQLDALRQRLRQSAIIMPDLLRSRFRPLPARLNALSPLAVLGRGYALAFKKGDMKVLYGVSQATIGDDLSIWLGSGAIDAVVTAINERGGISRYEFRKEE